LNDILGVDAGHPKVQTSRQAPINITVDDAFNPASPKPVQEHCRELGELHPKILIPSGEVGRPAEANNQRHWQRPGTHPLLLPAAKH
jgi:hypothetical protein